MAGRLLDVSQNKRTGRPPSSTGSQREAILSAARGIFATNGFRGTTMRAVAGQAGVDVALVAHYFTNKEGLFTATLQLPENAADAMLQAMTAPAAQRGERLTRAYLGLWEAPETREQLRVVARSALGSQDFGSRMEAVIAHILSGAVSAGGAGASRGATEVALAQLLGVAVTRHLLQVPTVADLPFDRLIDIVAPGVQTILALQHEQDA